MSNTTIGIDLRVLSTGRHSGIEEYTEQLMSRMLPLGRDIKFKLFYSSGSRRIKKYPWLSLPNVHLVESAIPNRALLWGAAVAGKPKIDTLMGGVDVFFSPHFILAPLTKGTPHVITFHDLSFERFPEFFSLRRRLWHSVQMRPRRQALSAAGIIAVSDSTKRDLIKLYGVDGTKITRIYSGISGVMGKPDKNKTSAYLESKKLNRRYIFSLGAFEPRKNLEGLIDAFSLIKREDRFADVALVIAGSSGWLEGGIFKTAGRSGFSGDIIFMPNISDEERAFLYSGAAIFVYPSFFEGFGFPPLEAMKCGTPVIASHTSSLPEILGQAALAVDPYNLSDIAAAMKAFLDEPSLRREFIKLGTAQADKFSWELTARQTLDMLVSLAK